jgi:membrane-associated protease RseP (regulator of RpoE activity)
MAAWVGMLITGLNMMPVSQLDGGHVVYGLFGRHAKIVSRGFLLSALAYMVITENYSWSVMVILVTFMGVDHPPTANEHVPLGPVRTVLGLLSLAIPVLCFMPTPISQ